MAEQIQPRMPRHVPMQDSEHMVSALLTFVRAIAAVTGIVVMIVGIILAVRVFSSIYATCQAPEDASNLILRWAEVFEAAPQPAAAPAPDDLGPPQEYRWGVDGARVVAVALLGCGALALAWIAIGIVTAGGRIVAWTCGERFAVKRLLEETFGAIRIDQARRSHGRTLFGRRPVGSDPEPTEPDS